MQIVTVIARLNVGGPARHVTWLIEGMRARGANCELIAGVVPPGEDDMTHFAREHGVEPLIIKEMSREISLKDVVTLWKLYRLFCRLRPDVIDTHTAKAGTVGRIAGLLYRWLTPMSLLARPRPVRFVHTFHGHVFHSYYGKLKTGIFLFIERALARVTQRIIVVSHQQRQEINCRFNVGTPTQFAVIPCGLEVTAFKTTKEKRHILRDEIRAAQNDVVVGIVGRLTEIKNHRLFLEAVGFYKNQFGLQMRRGGSVRFVIIGDGALRSTLERQARTAGVEHDVVFVGNRIDIEDWYTALDVVTLCSLNEGLPLTLIEAMLARRAIVATQVGGVVDLLGEANEAVEGYEVCERGIGTTSGDARGLATAWRRLIEDEVLREQLAHHGNRYARRYLSRERMVDDVARVFAQVHNEETRT